MRVTSGDGGGTILTGSLALSVVILPNIATEQLLLLFLLD